MNTKKIMVLLAVAVLTTPWIVSKTANSTAEGLTVDDIQFQPQSFATIRFVPQTGPAEPKVCVYVNEMALIPFGTAMIGLSALP